MNTASTWAPIGLWLAIALACWPRVAWQLIHSVCGDGLGVDAFDVAIGYVLGSFLAVLWPLWVVPLLAYRRGLLLPAGERRRRQAERIAELERELGLEPAAGARPPFVDELWRSKAYEAGMKRRQR